MVAKKPPSIPSTEQARKRLTVAQLKTILKSVHLSVDGLKADLLKRLETHVSNDDDDDDDDSKTTPVFHHRLDFLFENLFAAAQAAPASLFDRKFP